MAIVPLVFTIPPMINIFALPAKAATIVAQGNILVYLLGIPAIVPAALAAYSVVGEREQGTLEPVLTTPITREEFLLGKAVAAFVPSVLIAYAIYGLVLAAIEVFAQRAIATALIQLPQVAVQLGFTPLLAAWSICVAMTISARSRDVRVAQQLATLAGLPAVAVAALIAYSVIHASVQLAAGLADRAVRADQDRLAAGVARVRSRAPGHREHVTRRSSTAAGNDARSCAASASASASATDAK